MSEEEIVMIRERLARQDETVESLRRDFTETKADVKQILAMLNQLSGGKRAAIWAFGAIAGIIGACASVVMIWKYLK